MPRGDRTGPLGNGPMTGRGAGYCSGSGIPGYKNAGMGHGRGFGGGRCFGGGGRGWRNMFYATGLPFWARGYPAFPAGYEPEGSVNQGQFTPEREVEALKAQSEFFRKQMDVLNGRIKEMEELVSKKRDQNA